MHVSSPDGPRMPAKPTRSTGPMRIRSLFHKGGRLKHPHEWDHDTAASVASIEVVTRNLGDGTVEYVRTIKLWDEGKALEIPALRPACRRGASDSRSWASTRRTWRSETPSSRAMARVAFWGSAARAAMIWRSANRSTGESLKPGPAAQSRAGLRPGLGFRIEAAPSTRRAPTALARPMPA